MPFRKVPMKVYCIECRWCAVKVDLDGGSNYFCSRKGKALANSVLFSPACAQFEPFSGSLMDMGKARPYRKDRDI